MNMLNAINSKDYCKKEYLPDFQNRIKLSEIASGVKVENFDSQNNYYSTSPQEQHTIQKYQPQNIQTCCSQKTASFRSLEYMQKIENIYQMSDYFTSLGDQVKTIEFLKKYQVDYQDIKKVRCHKQVKYQINFQHLKQLYFAASKYNESQKVSDFIQNYSFQKLEYDINSNSVHEKKSEKIFQASKNSQQDMIKNNDQLIQNLEEQVIKTINLPKIPQKDLCQQITKQFFLFMASSYKILKKFENSNQKLINKQSTSKKLKNYSKEEEYQLIQQLLESTASDFVEEFILYKDITESWRLKWKNSISNKIYQPNQDSVKEIEFKQQLSEEVKQSSDTQKFNVFCQHQQQYQQIDSQKHTFKDNNKSINLNQLNDFKPRQNCSKKKSKLSSKEQQDCSQETNSQDEYCYKEDQYEVNYTNSDGNFQKKRTNNFYNMPRYFMMLMLEFLSEKNLQYLNIQDGVRQVITKIKHNIAKQGKKKDSAKSNFYNHTHYNCLFKIIDEKPFFNEQQNDIKQLQQNKNVNKNKQIQQKQTDFDRQMDDLIKRLQIIQELPLAQYILQNGESYEKSKVNYIARVIAGIEKLNEGYDIYRF